MGLVWTTLGLGLLGAGAYESARHGLRQPAGLPRILAAVILGWSWLTIGMEALGTVGWLTREALLAWSAAGLLIGLSFRWLGQKELPDEGGENGPSEGWGWSGLIAVWLTLWVIAIYGFGSLLYPVKVVSDGPIYHLFFAARWWKSHQLELVAAPFGENAATYFPANGDLWFSWLMIFWEGDRLARVGQGPFLLISGMAVMALARRLGAGQVSALISASWFMTSAPLLLFSFEANVDTIFIAGYLLAVYFFVRYALGDDDAQALALGALAAGLALGCKATSIVFVPPLLALATLPAVMRGRGVAAKLGGVLAVWLLPLLVGGFWYARNYLLTGNPLYPLHVKALGHVWLAGWYGPDVMHRSAYYVPFSDWRAFCDQFLGNLDPHLLPVWLAALAGAWAWGKGARSPIDAAVWGCAALAIVNVALYWLFIPYRTQQRFALHAVALAAIPLARTFDRGRPVRAFAVALLAVHIVTPQAWPSPGIETPAKEPAWDLSPLIPNNPPALIPVPLDLDSLQNVFLKPREYWGLGGASLGVGAASFAAAWSWARLAGRPSRRRLAIATGATFAFAAFNAALLNPWGANPRQMYFPRFPDYYRGWQELDIRSGSSGARVAYAGNDLPYYLMGVGFRNDVRYVNVDAHPGWLLHDYHRAASTNAPTTWDHPRPGWDRIHPEYDAWLANLRAEGIQLLVVTQANPQEGPHNIADSAGFTIEAVWAAAHPETFEPLYGVAERDPRFRLYRIRPPQ